MSFVGDLEHLPIVDVIQLLHSTRKTGTLCLKSLKGQSQLVFSDGYIVSANHVNTSVRIGKVLVEMNKLSEEELENALMEQSNAGADRVPLIATLIESGKINKDDAYKGLETLIEMTIVEVLTWTKGTFELDVNTVVISDEYRYFPETFDQDLYLNTQSVLMDALRIYDEKMRDGTLTDETFSMDEVTTEEMYDETQVLPEISADLLGLEDLDKVERKTPEIFSAVKIHDPFETQRNKIMQALPDVPVDEQERLLAYIKELSDTSRSTEEKTFSTGPSPAVILFSQDELIKQTVTMVCSHEGYFVFTTDEEVSLDLIIDQSLSKGLKPLLMIDTPNKTSGGFSDDRIIDMLQQKLLKYPRISVLQLIASVNFEFSLHALNSGVRTILPRPSSEERKGTLVQDTLTFLAAFRSYLKSFIGPDRHVLNQFKGSIFELSTLKEAPEVSFVLLRYVATICERCITFVVGPTELVAERGIGINSEKDAGVTPPLRFKIPLNQPSVFQAVIKRGRLFYGQSHDSVLSNHLFTEIGPPRSSSILLVPIKSQGRVIALIYGDFGQSPGSPVEVDIMEILSWHAGLVLDNAFYRKKFEKPF